MRVKSAHRAQILLAAGTLLAAAAIATIAPAIKARAAIANVVDIKSATMQQYNPCKDPIVQSFGITCIYKGVTYSGN
jgi:hypothetical protein